MASMTSVKCACCKKEFQARTADVARGWGKFCSKRCKAIDQTGRKVPAKRPASRWETDQEMHDQAMHDSTQGWDEGGWLNC